MQLHFTDQISDNRHLISMLVQKFTSDEAKDDLKLYSLLSRAVRQRQVLHSEVHHGCVILLAHARNMPVTQKFTRDNSLPSIQADQPSRSSSVWANRSQTVTNMTSNRTPSHARFLHYTTRMCNVVESNDCSCTYAILFNNKCQLLNNTIPFERPRPRFIY